METTMQESYSTLIRWSWGLVALLLVGLAVGGCGNVSQKKNGQMKVSWEVQPDGCAPENAENVETVEARLNVQGESSSRTKSFDCSKGQGKIQGLKPANYKVRLVGLDADGEEIYDSKSSKNVTVRSEETSQIGPFRLTASPAELVVSWVIGGRCAAKGIEDIEVAVFKESFEQARQSAKCVDPDVTIGELPPGEYRVEVLGKDGNGTTTYEGSQNETLTQGQTKNIEVELQEK